MRNGTKNNKSLGHQSTGDFSRLLKAKFFHALIGM
jgi:hypothetical protein